MTSCALPKTEPVGDAFPGGGGGGDASQSTVLQPIDDDNDVMFVMSRAPPRANGKEKVRVPEGTQVGSGSGPLTTDRAARRLVASYS